MLAGEAPELRTVMRRQAAASGAGLLQDNHAMDTHHEVSLPQPLHDALDRLSRHSGVLGALLIGSLAAGALTPASDYDLAQLGLGVAPAQPAQASAAHPAAWLLLGALLLSLLVLLWTGLRRWRARG